MDSSDENPVDILISYWCWSDIALDIAMTLLIYWKWNTWWRQFAVSTWHQDIGIEPIRLLMSSWHRRNNGRYLVERNPPGSYATSVSAIIIPCFYCVNWKIKSSGNFFQLLPPEDIMSYWCPGDVLKTSLYCSRKPKNVHEIRTSVWKRVLLALNWKARLKKPLSSEMARKQ